MLKVLLRKKLWLRSSFWKDRNRWNLWSGVIRNPLLGVQVPSHQVCLHCIVTNIRRVASPSALLSSHTFFCYLSIIPKQKANWHCTKRSPRIFRFNLKTTRRWLRIVKVTRATVPCTHQWLIRRRRQSGRWRSTMWATARALTAPSVVLFANVSNASFCLLNLYSHTVSSFSSIVISKIIFLLPICAIASMKVCSIKSNNIFFKY